MLFNSVDFAIFLPIVFCIYWFITNKNLRLQNIFIVLASYFFYSCWDWRFLSIIILSTIFNYSIGLWFKKIPKKSIRKTILIVSVIINLSVLCYFKYFNFFVENFTAIFRLFGHNLNIHTLRIILPVGISFYTFQAMSYIIDVYRDRISPTKDFIAFAAFICFFPQLLAGPIERAVNLLPQFLEKRHFDYAKATDGLRQILWGLVKKVVIADVAGEYVNQIFQQSETLSGSTLALGVFLFSFQIYGDFSGYSDIAIGSARLLGINLRQNFAYPNFSRDVPEFWRRWHISLSAWFRDYLYIPLGGSRAGTWKTIRNVWIVFLVSGFWHGADWTFVIWGGINALYMMPSIIRKTNRKNLEIVAKGKLLPSMKDVLNISGTFILITFSRIFFRSDNIQQAFQYTSTIFSKSFFELPSITPSIIVIILLILFTVIEWIGREHQYAIEKFGFKWKKWMRIAFYYILVILILAFSGKAQQFVYFQF